MANAKASADVKPPGADTQPEGDTGDKGSPGIRGEPGIKGEPATKKIMIRRDDNYLGGFAAAALFLEGASIAFRPGIVIEVPADYADRAVKTFGPRVEYVEEWNDPGQRMEWKEYPIPPQLVITDEPVNAYPSIIGLSFE